MTSRPAISNTPSERSIATSRSMGCGSSSIAPTALLIKSRPRPYGARRGSDKIAVEPNGLNINFQVGSTAPEALSRKVREMRADVGIALDGDADRLVIVDEKGHLVDGDQVMAVIAESWRDEGRLSLPGIVATVMSNLGVERHLESLGLALERTAVETVT